MLSIEVVYGYFTHKKERDRVPPLMPPSRDTHRDTVSRVIVSVPPPFVSLMTMVMANMSRGENIPGHIPVDGIPELCTTEYWDAMDHLSAY